MAQGGFMYGTTMIGKLAKNVTAADVRAELTAWEKARNVPGYMSTHALVTDDGRTVVNVAVFESKEAYLALADDPAQDAWWREHYAPLLDGEPQWIDGEWIA
jgi:Antibiotic biosynthesis monooxygenase